MCYFVFGILHGVFYFGDITRESTPAGLVLLLYVDRDVESDALRAIGGSAWWQGGDLQVDRTNAYAATEYVADIKDNFEVFSYGSYLEQLPVRIGEFGDLIVGNFIGLPLTVALMLTGMLAQRAGWLQQRDARVWRTRLRWAC